MKIHAVSRFRTIERISKYRHSQSIGMGTVNAQLMGAACKGLQPHGTVGQKLKVRNGLLTTFIIYYLTRTVIEIS